MYATSMCGAWEYCSRNLDWLCKAYPESGTINRIRRKAEETKAAAQQAVGGSDKDKIKLAQQKRYFDGLEGKIAAGKFEKALKKEGVAVQESRNWMAKEPIPKSTEKIIFGIRDQTLPTRYNMTKKWGKPGPTVCRLCGKAPETEEHLLTSCGAISFLDITQRHDGLCRSIVAATCRAHGVEFPYAYWKGRIPSFINLNQSDGSYIRWSPSVHTLQKVEHNKPDLMIQLANGRILLIEVTVCKDECVVDRSEKKAMKYIELRDDLAKQKRKHRVEVIAIAVGATGAISERTKQSCMKLNKYGIPIRVSQLQKAATI